MALKAHQLASIDGLDVAIVDCAGGDGDWAPPELVSVQTIVFVRRGLFARSADGRDSLLDPTMAYCQRPGQEVRFAHPAGQGDQCLSLSGQGFMEALGLTSDDLPALPVSIAPGSHLAHRLLARQARSGGDGFDVYEGAAVLISAVLEGRDALDPRDKGRPATARARRRLVASTREALVENPSIGLIELSRLVSSSPHHLSRMFSAEMGQTLSTYRNRLRTALALERLDLGESDLTGLAADLGFADHAHMTRVIREQLGETPSRLRSLLTA